MVAAIVKHLAERVSVSPDVSLQKTDKTVHRNLGREKELAPTSSRESSREDQAPVTALFSMSRQSLYWGLHGSSDPEYLQSLQREGKIRGSGPGKCKPCSTVAQQRHMQTFADRKRRATLKLPDREVTGQQGEAEVDSV